MSDEGGQAGVTEDGERSGEEDEEDQRNQNAPCNMGDDDNDGRMGAVGGVDDGAAAGH